MVSNHKYGFPFSGGLAICQEGRVQWSYTHIIGLHTFVHKCEFAEIIVWRMGPLQQIRICLLVVLL